VTGRSSAFGMSQQYCNMVKLRETFCRHYLLLIEELYISWPTFDLTRGCVIRFNASGWMKSARFDATYGTAPNLLNHSRIMDHVQLGLQTVSKITCSGR